MMAGKDGSRGGDEGKTGLVTKTRPKTKRPSLYKVLLLNDDYTPMEFVVLVLQEYFRLLGSWLQSAWEAASWDSYSKGF